MRIVEKRGSTPSFWITVPPSIEWREQLERLFELPYELFSLHNDLVEYDRYISFESPAIGFVVTEGYVWGNIPCYLHVELETRRSATPRLPPQLPQSSPDSP